LWQSMDGSQGTVLPHLVISSILMKDATCYSEMLVNFYQTTWLHIPEDYLHNDCHENHKSCKYFYYTRFFPWFMCTDISKWKYHPWLQSDFCRNADENCALLGYNAVSSGNPLCTFRDNVSVPSSRVKLLDPWRWDQYVVPKFW
jgi:hypothetical protein